MNYFDKNNEAMRPYIEYDDKYVLYNIDTNNRTAGLEIYFNTGVKTIEYAEKLINDALRNAFTELNLNKVYVNVIRDNYPVFDILHRFNFITEAIHRGQYFDGTIHDVVYMTALKNEWQLGGIRYNFKYDRYAIDTEQ